MSFRRRPVGAGGPRQGVLDSHQQLYPYHEHTQQLPHLQNDARLVSGRQGDRPAAQMQGHTSSATIAVSSSDREQLNDIPMSPADIIIAVMGITGSGKTTLISRCMGEDVGIGHGLESCTQDVAIHSFRHRGRIVRMIDTPGFDDTSRADVNILNNIAFWLSHAYRATPKLLLSGIIYLHPVLETRMSGTAMKNLEMMRRLCGEQNLGAIWLATTMWGLVDPMIGQQRERQLIAEPDFWGDLIRGGSKVRRHQDTDVSAFSIVDDIIARSRPVALRIQCEMVDERRSVDETDAGRYLRRNVINEQQRVQERLARSADELEQQLAAQDAAEVDEVLERQRRYQAQIDERSRSLAAMQLDMETLRKQKAQELAEREEEFSREKSKQQQKMAELEGQLRQLKEDREDVVRRADENAQKNQQLEDANLRHALQRDYATIAALDRVISERQREEDEAAASARQLVKQESIFRKTLKVSMAETLVHGVIHGASAIIQAACTVM
jgi:hypothetical protein